jgi:hypothetical protein
MGFRFKRETLNFLWRAERKKIMEIKIKKKLEIKWFLFKKTFIL